MTKISVGERMTLLGVLPKEGNFATLKVVRKLQEELSFSEEEFKKYGIVQEKDQIRWNPDVDSKEQKDVQIGEKAADIIRDALVELDSTNKLNQQLITLYEKFVETK